MNMAISLRSEILKTKRTASFYFTLIGAAVVPVVFLLNVLGDGLDSTKKDPLNMIFKLLADMNGLAFFPWFIILICTLLPQIEYRNNTWKQVFTSPQPKVNVLTAKFVNIHLLMLLFLVSTHLFMYLAILLANFIDPDLGLFNHPLNGRTVLVNAANSYVTMLALGAIHFWLGIRFKNFIVPIAVGLALWLTGTLLVQCGLLLSLQLSGDQSFPKTQIPPGAGPLDVGRVCCFGSFSWLFRFEKEKNGRLRSCLS
jgi:hypothetical protein